MLIIDFCIGTRKYTWFIDSNYVGILAFIIGLLGGFIYKYRKSKVLEKGSRKKFRRIRGGDHLSDCVDPSSGYEVINEELKKIIYHMLGINEPIPAVLPITAEILFLGKVVLLRKLGTQLNLLGLKAVVTNVRSTTVKAALGGAAGLGMMIFANPAAFMGGGLVFFAFAVNIYFGDIKCPNYVDKLEVFQARLASGKSPYVDLPPGKNRMLVMPEKSTAKEKAITVYVEDSKPVEKCSEEVEDSGSVKRSCYTERKYVPLKERTKTLRDLRQEDPSDVYRAANPDIERYQRKTAKLRSERIPNSEEKEL